jgi:hypothetical protein
VIREPGFFLAAPHVRLYVLSFPSVNIPWACMRSQKKKKKKDDIQKDKLRGHHGVLCSWRSTFRKQQKMGSCERGQSFHERKAVNDLDSVYINIYTCHVHRQHI